MRVISGLLQAFAIIFLVLGVFLLAIDPRLRDLVVQDLSVVIPGIKSSEERPTTTPGPSQSNKEGASQPSKAAQGPPTITESGYAIAPGCALWTAEGLGLYYSPVNPSTVCVQPPGSSAQAGTPAAPGSTQVPPNCAVAPDSVIYCVVDGQLSADTLKAFYDRGELQTPREPGGG